jgi:hypothetical protein
MQPSGAGAGAIIAGKYRIQRMVGEGGMGMVLAAEHVHLGQPVAIKLLHVGADDNVVQRFLREARVVAQLRSVHVPRMLDVDRLESGEPYLVMESYDPQKPGMLLSYVFANDKMNEPTSSIAADPPQGNSFRLADVDFGRVSETLTDAARRTPDRPRTIATALLQVGNGELEWIVCVGPRDRCVFHHYDGRGHHR